MKASDDFIKNLIVRIVRDYEPTAEIILFGSRARGDAREDSDWDVLILIDGDRVTFEQSGAISYELWAQGLDYGHEINPLLHTHKQWDNAPPSLFKHNVLAEGIHL